MSKATNNPDGSVTLKSKGRSAEDLEAWALRPPPELPVFVGHAVSISDHFSATTQTYFELYVGDALTEKFSVTYVPYLR